MGNITNKVEHLQWIDAVKGFTILLVVLGHCFGGYKDAGMFVEQKYWYMPIYNFIYSFHMPLFFMISGFLFYSVYREADKNRMSRKIIDIILLYFQFSIVQCIVQLALAGKVNKSLDVSDILLLPVYAVAPYWYLYVLAFLYMIAFFTRRASMNAMLMGTLIVSLFSYMVHISIFCASSVLFHMYFFVAGGYWGYANTKQRLGLMIFALVGVIVIWLFSPELPMKRVFVALLLSTIYMYLFSNIKVLSTNRLFNICGKYCLPIYLVHCYLTAGTRIALKVAHNNNIWLYVASGMVLGVIVPIVVYRICEKYSCLEFVFHPVNFLQRVRFMNC